MILNLRCVRFRSYFHHWFKYQSCQIGPHHNNNKETTSTYILRPLFVIQPSLNNSPSSNKPCFWFFSYLRTYPRWENYLILSGTRLDHVVVDEKKMWSPLTQFFFSPGSITIFWLHYSFTSFLLAKSDWRGSWLEISRPEPRKEKTIEFTWKFCRLRAFAKSGRKSRFRRPHDDQCNWLECYRPTQEISHIYPSLFAEFWRRKLKKTCRTRGLAAASWILVAFSLSKWS